jgi:hypothetical protein
MDDAVTLLVATRMLWERENPGGQEVARARPFTDEDEPRRGWRRLFGG